MYAVHYIYSKLDVPELNLLIIYIIYIIIHQNQHYFDYFELYK